MNETNLHPRQKRILNLINTDVGIARRTIEESVSSVYPSSKATIARDLAVLLSQKFIKVNGKGKNTKYYPSTANPLLRLFDLEKYFEEEADQRNGATVFDFGIFDHIHNLFSDQEKETLGKKTKKFSVVEKKLNPSIFQKELERFTIELAWKSSRIEGNTYTLLETETLIQQNIQAKGRSKKEAIMILNHKRAFEEILKRKNAFKAISFSTITQLHNVLMKGLAIETGIRKQPVGITGTAYKPLDNQWQIKEALEKLIQKINSIPYPLEKALIAHSFISYIQPFADGNKRTGRILANTILIAHDYYPLSYRSVDETTYKKALILFYEQKSLYWIKRILIDQYLFALETYFTTKKILRKSED